MSLYATKVVDLELPPHLVDYLFPMHAVYVEYEDTSDEFKDCCTLEIIRGLKRPYDAVAADDMLEQFGVSNIEEAREKLEGLCIADLFDLADEDVWFD